MRKKEKKKKSQRGPPRDGCKKNFIQNVMKKLRQEKPDFEFDFGGGMAQGPGKGMGSGGSGAQCPIP